MVYYVLITTILVHQNNLSYLLNDAFYGLFATHVSPSYKAVIGNFAK